MILKPILASAVSAYRLYRRVSLSMMRLRSLLLLAQEQNRFSGMFGYFCTASVSEPDRDIGVRLADARGTEDAHESALPFPSMSPGRALVGRDRETDTDQRRQGVATESKSKLDHGCLPSHDR
jgi:hypothetical protein